MTYDVLSGTLNSTHSLFCFTLSLVYYGNLYLFILIASLSGSILSSVQNQDGDYNRVLLVASSMIIVIVAVNTVVMWLITGNGQTVLSAVPTVCCWSCLLSSLHTTSQVVTVIVDHDSSSE